MRGRLARVYQPDLRPRQTRRLLRVARECRVGSERRWFPQSRFRDHGMATDPQLRRRPERPRAKHLPQAEEVDDRRRL